MFTNYVREIIWISQGKNCYALWKIGFLIFSIIFSNQFLEKLFKKSFFVNLQVSHLLTKPQTFTKNSLHNFAPTMSKHIKSRKQINFFAHLWKNSLNINNKIDQTLWINGRPATFHCKMSLINENTPHSLCLLAKIISAHCWNIKSHH